SDCSKPASRATDHHVDTDRQLERQRCRALDSLNPGHASISSPGTGGASCECTATSVRREGEIFGFVASECWVKSDRMQIRATVWSALRLFSIWIAPRAAADVFHRLRRAPPQMFSIGLRRASP